MNDQMRLSSTDLCLAVQMAASAQPGKLKRLAPLPLDRWAVPGTRTSKRLFTRIERAFRRGLLTPMQAQARIDAELQRAVRRALAGDPAGRSLEPSELLQDLHERLATMNAAARYDRRKASRQTYLGAIAGVVVHEKTRRRPRPMPVSLHSLGEPSGDGDQLKRLERDESLRRLSTCLSKLSPGEIRALVAEFGPLFGHWLPVAHRRSRRVRNRAALPQAVELLRSLMAQEKAMR